MGRDCMLKCEGECDGNRVEINNNTHREEREVRVYGKSLFTGTHSEKKIQPRLSQKSQSFSMKNKLNSNKYTSRKILNH